MAILEQMSGTIHFMLFNSPGSVDSMATIGFEDETTNVTKVVQDSIESANVSAQFAIGNIETVSGKDLRSHNYSM